MSDNVVRFNKKPGKIPTSITDAMKELYGEYIILSINKENEFCFTIEADSHASAFQMLLLAGGHVYKDQFTK